MCARVGRGPAFVSSAVKMRYILSSYLMHFGVRVTHYASGPPVAEISKPLEAGHFIDGEPPSPDAVHASMVRFDARQILMTGELDEDGGLVCTSSLVERVLHERSAIALQRGFRRFLRAGTPVLPMPPLWV